MTRPTNKNDGEAKENPTNVRNGKDLINAAVDAFENDRCRTAMIQPQGQAFYMDCRTRSFRDFSPLVSILQRGGDCGRWLARSRAGSYTNPVASPLPQQTALFHLGPSVAKELKEGLLREMDKPLSQGDGKVMHLLFFEGDSGRAVQKYHIAHTAGEAASIAFHQLANGYAMVLAGTVLAECWSPHTGFPHVKAWRHCSSVQELEAVASSQPDRGPDESYLRKEVIGIIY